MADIEFGEMPDGAVEAGDPAGGGRVAGLMNGLGAVTSVALIVGLGVWGYQLWQRDVSGIPVVRALEGPMRIAPEDPGGSSADHQGLAVNNIAAIGEAAAPADRLVLAPAATLITGDDHTAGELVEAEREAVAAQESDRVDAATPAIVSEALATDLAVAEALGDLSLAAVTDDTVTDGLIPASVSGVSKSRRPLVRPANLQIARVAPVTPTPTGALITVDPDTIAIGTRLAQLGAFESREIAEAEWARLATRFEDFMGDKSRVIQEASSGGNIFYRLRAMGFVDVSDARRFCSALLAGQATCIPVVTR